ncbi:AlpA family transcriptional regulator [bacterium BD-1]|nr:AlpA family transcriptional regulator [Ottowia caeni]
MTDHQERLFPTNAAHLERLPSVLARTGLSRSTIYKKVADGQFPRPVKLGERAVAWHAAAVTDWITARAPANDPVGG